MTCTESIKVSLLIDNIKSTMSCQTELRLPAAADFIFRLEREIHKLDNNIDKIIEVIEQKPLLVSRLIKYINSDEFKDKIRKYPSHRIDSVEQAINAYGIKHLQKFALSYILNDIAFNFRLLKDSIHYGLSCAVCCSEIAHHVINIKRDAAYMYGLVKDYGHIVLAYRYGDTYRSIFETNRIDPLTAMKRVEDELQLNVTFVHVAIASCFGIGLKREDNLDWIDERSILLAAQEQFHANFACIEAESVRKLIAIGYIGSVMNNRIHGLTVSDNLLLSFERAKKCLELTDKQIDEAEACVRKQLNDE